MRERDIYICIYNLYIYIYMQKHPVIIVIAFMRPVLQSQEPCGNITTSSTSHIIIQHDARPRFKPQHD